MQQQRAVRVIKRGHTRAAESMAVNDGDKRGVNLERSVRAVVSGWVREQQQRSQESWRQHAALLAGVGFQRG
ncbi:MAG: hypothetical protein M3407_06190 [Acidobacteriota bacterium]|nr:hypothetical protein [Acidobacteriota bacterium]